MVSYNGDRIWMFFAVRSSCIPKQLARWLLDHFDPWDNSLKLANHKGEDVHASLVLPMGPQEVIEAKQLDDNIQYIQAQWNVKSGGPPIGTMDEIILEHGDHGADFKRDFVVYTISTCIMGNLCYLDRVEFQGKRMDRWFLIAINWTIEDVKKREKD
ncbi:hypothetical protein Cgig2_027993 [Carnegiea gigantea]|uniref:Uncharacterized protein n=1 Tax=Carnegiea gigantea TaxID=171969 RepID=A0A9Q1JJ56_9CARY|nr:hypothetical protein Cgig2_027993 [Carnegiea gigantea]